MIVLPSRGKYDSRMAIAREPNEAIFAVDVGATNIKFAVVDDVGTFLNPVRRRPTPYPLSPVRLVRLIASRAGRSGCARVGVGFPGAFRDGRVVAPGNLARPGGVGTEVDPELDRQWRGFALQDALRAATGLDVRVVNDATLAALGASTGEGVEVVLTLGTGLGLALVVDGVPTPVRDVGAEMRADGRTYDQSFGESARSADELRWRVDLGRVIEEFVAEFRPRVVHLAGGNARRVDLTWFASVGVPVTIEGNEAPLRGAARLF